MEAETVVRVARALDPSWWPQIDHWLGPDLQGGSPEGMQMRHTQIMRWRNQSLDGARIAISAMIEAAFSA